MKKARFYAIIVCVMGMANVGMSVEYIAFGNSQCTIELQQAGGGTEIIPMTGGSVMAVFLAGTGGETFDSDGDMRQLFRCLRGSDHRRADAA